jgi:ribosomal protein L3 glutamine methyltransferase
MDFVRRLLDAAPAHLADHGVLVVEIGHEADHFEAAFPDLEFAWLPVAAGERMIAIVTRTALDVRLARR